MRTDLVAENLKGVGDTHHRIEERILFILVDFHDDLIDRSSLRTKNGMFTNSFDDKLEYAAGTKAIHLTKAEEERERSRMKKSPGRIRSEEDNPRFSEPGMPDKNNETEPPR